MAKLTGFVYVLLLVTVQPLGAQAWLYEVLGAAGGVAVMAVGAPVVLAAAGFGAGGIVAGSLAAKAMSVAYTTHVGLGALAALQSAGVTGVAVTTVVAGGLVGAGAGYIVGSHSGKEEDNAQKENNN